MLSDDEWAQIARDVMDRTSLSPYGQEDDAVRWVAIRHGDDHIHLVAMLARQDRRRPRLDFERHNVRERAWPLRNVTGWSQPRLATAPQPAARPAGRRRRPPAVAWTKPPRVTLRRQVITAAAGAGSEQEFFARLDHAGVLVRQRFSAMNPGRGHRVRGRPARRHGARTAGRCGTAAASSPPT